MRQLERPVCLLTGASGSLGRKLCEDLQQTHDIAAVHLRRNISVSTQYQVYIDPLEPHAEIQENSHPVFAIKADLSIEHEIDRVVELVLARFGKVDLLINGAGSCLSRPLATDGQCTETAVDQFRMNVFVPLRLMKLLLDRFWRGCPADNLRNNRNVVNISSIAGMEIFAGRGFAIYGASKAALNFLTCASATEFQDFGVRVNAIAPNSFPSLVPIEEVVKAVRYLETSSVQGRICVLDKDRQNEAGFVCHSGISRDNQPNLLDEHL